MDSNARDAPARHQSARSRHVANGPIEEPGKRGRQAPKSWESQPQSMLAKSARRLVAQPESSTARVGILRPTSAIGDGESEESRSEEERGLEETNKLATTHQPPAECSWRTNSTPSGRATAHGAVGQRHGQPSDQHCAVSILQQTHSEAQL